MSWPVSVQICTLNEAPNIAECLERVQANEPAEIIVIDGGSTDGTARIARAHGAEVIEAGRIGLARQRRLGYSRSTQPFTAFVDADDRLPPRWLELMLNECESGGYAAIQSQLRVPDPGNFWTRGWDGYLREAIRTTHDTNMVGRPALFRTEALRGIATEPGMIVEDTEMSRDFQLRGLRQGIGSAVSYRLCPGTARENISKWHGYGRGYRQFVEAHSDRRASILRHILWTIPVVRGVRPMLRGRWQQPAFSAVMAWSIATGYIAKKSPRDSSVP